MDSRLRERAVPHFPRTRISQSLDLNFDVVSATSREGRDELPVGYAFFDCGHTEFWCLWSSLHAYVHGRRGRECLGPLAKPATRSLDCPGMHRGRRVRVSAPDEVGNLVVGKNMCLKKNYSLASRCAEPVDMGRRHCCCDTVSEARSASDVLKCAAVPNATTMAM